MKKNNKKRKKKRICAEPFEFLLKNFSFSSFQRKDPPSQKTGGGRNVYTKAIGEPLIRGSRVSTRIHGSGENNDNEYDAYSTTNQTYNERQR